MVWKTGRQTEVLTGFLKTRAWQTQSKNSSGSETERKKKRKCVWSRHNKNNQKKSLGVVSKAGTGRVEREKEKIRDGYRRENERNTRKERWETEEKENNYLEAEMKSTWQKRNALTAAEKRKQNNNSSQVGAGRKPPPRKKLWADKRGWVSDWVSEWVNEGESRDACGVLSSQTQSSERQTRPWRRGPYSYPSCRSVLTTTLSSVLHPHRRCRRCSLRTSALTARRNV